MPVAIHAKSQKPPACVASGSLRKLSSCSTWKAGTQAKQEFQNGRVQPRSSSSEGSASVCQTTEKCLSERCKLLASHGLPDCGLDWVGRFPRHRQLWCRACWLQATTACGPDGPAPLEYSQRFSPWRRPFRQDTSSGSNSDQEPPVLTSTGQEIPRTGAQQRCNTPQTSSKAMQIP